jgi:hypothetical protein
LTRSSLPAARIATLSLLASVGLFLVASARVLGRAGVRTSEDLAVSAIRVEAGERLVMVGLEHARLSIDAATGCAEVSRPLELVGVASVAWRTSENIEIERAIFIPARAAVQPGASEGALRVSSVAHGYTASWSGVPVRSEALELGAPRAGPSD